MLQMHVIMLRTCMALIINKIKSFEITRAGTGKHFETWFWHGLMHLPV
jgi:hypothetical protein